jgi:hypothetical protein
MALGTRMALSMRCANADNIVYIPWVRILIKRIKFEKLSDPDITFPETLHEKTPTMQSTSKEVQSEGKTS